MTKSSKKNTQPIAKITIKDKRLHKELMLKEAKGLIKRGFAVVVLHPGRKEPATRNGVYDATKSYVALKRIVRDMEDFNLAVATGDPSNVVVLDIDRRSGGHRSWDKLVSELGEPGADLPTVRTGDGLHIYGRVAKASFTKMTLRPGVEVLGNSSYALVPSSLHPLGKTYKWIKRLPRIGTKLPKLSPRWLKAARDFAAGKGSGEAARRSTTNGQFLEGERNIGLTSLGGKLRRKGYDEAAIRRRLVKANAKFCKPPLPKDEIAEIARSVAKYPDGKSVGDTNTAEVASDYPTKRLHRVNVRKGGARRRNAT